MTYAIAKRFSPEARRFACSLPYVGTATVIHGTTCCPLGAALYYEKKIAPGFSMMPGPLRVGKALCPPKQEPWLDDVRALIETEARLFIQDWDDGGVEDLWDAFGVGPEGNDVEP